MNILIFISSLTGNTKKVALQVADHLRAAGHEVVVKNTHQFLREWEKPSRVPSVDQFLPPADLILPSADLILPSGNLILPSADLILLCFWCRRSSMDDDSLKLLSLYQDPAYSHQEFAAIGTMGGDVTGSYGQRVRQTVTDAIAEKNTCKGVFICQGKIRESRTEARRRLPATDPHYLDDEGYARHIATRSHPDKKDLMEAWTFLQKIIAVQ